MPDPIVILQAMAAAAVVATLFVLAFGRPWRQPEPKGYALGWTLGVGFGFLVGVAMLGFRPKVSLNEDMDRFLLLIIPAVLFVEVIAIFFERSAWWMRAPLAAALAPVLLFGSAYIADAAGPGTKLWSPGEAFAIFAATAIGVLAHMALVSLAHRRSAGRLMPAAMSLALVATSLTVMLSGYASGGQVAMPLAAALIAAAGVSFARIGAPPLGPLMIAVVVQACLLVTGRYFGSLTTLNAILLLVAPVVCWALLWLPVAVKVRYVVATLALVALLSTAVWRAQMQFVANSAPPTSQPPSTASPLDYLNFK